LVKRILRTCKPDLSIGCLQRCATAISYTPAMQPTPHIAPIRWPWRLFAFAAGLFDPISGLLAGVPGWAMGIGRTEHLDTPRRRRRGLIIVLGGIEGPSIHQRRMTEGLVRGGWRGAIVLQRWNERAPMIRILRNQVS